MRSAADAPKSDAQRVLVCSHASQAQLSQQPSSPANTDRFTPTRASSEVLLRLIQLTPSGKKMLTHRSQLSDSDIQLSDSDIKKLTPAEQKWLDVATKLIKKAPHLESIVIALGELAKEYSSFRGLEKHYSNYSNMLEELSDTFSTSKLFEHITEKETIDYFVEILDSIAHPKEGKLPLDKIISIVKAKLKIIDTNIEQLEKAKLEVFLDFYCHKSVQILWYSSCVMPKSIDQDMLDFLTSCEESGLNKALKDGKNDIFVTMMTVYHDKNHYQYQPVNIPDFWHHREAIKETIQCILEALNELDDKGKKEQLLRMRKNVFSIISTVISSSKLSNYPLHETFTILNNANINNSEKSIEIATLLDKVKSDFNHTYY